MKKEKDALKEIRGRRTVTAEQALTMLDVAAASDVETRGSLLSIASRSLNDPSVLEKWIELAADEKDDDLRFRMINRLLSIDARVISDPKAYVKLLVGALKDENVRSRALSMLGRILPLHPDVSKILIDHYKELRQNTTKRAILIALLASEDPSKSVVAFFKTTLDKVDGDLKAGLVDRLLRQDALAPADLKELLKPSEPSDVKWRVLNQVVDRTLNVGTAVRDAVLKDPDPAFRRQAIWVLAARGGKEAAALIDAARSDSDPNVRGEALVAIRSALGTNPDLVPLLLGVLNKDTNAEIVAFVLDLLTPMASRSSDVRKGLLGLLGLDLKAELAAKVYEALGKLLVWDRAMLDHFLEAYDKEKEDRVKSAILGAISQWHEPDVRLTKIFKAGLKSPAPKIREWALNGLVLVPMTEANCATVALGAEVLLDKAIDWHIRLDIARKIVKIPALTKELAEQLKKVADQGTDELKEICQKAADRAVSTEGAPAVDWDQWLRRVDVEQSVDGVFPTVFHHYDSNPEMARKVLRAALNPGCSNSMYQVSVSESHVLNFLVRKNAVDDDISRYCVNWIMTKGSEYGSPDFHLVVLKSNPNFPALKDSLWQILEHRDANPLLMRELLVLAYGSDVEASKALQRRVVEKKTAKLAKPYLKFLAGNLAWVEVEETFLEAIKKKGIVDEENKSFVTDAIRNLGKDPAKVLAKEKEGPGFADE